jgi:putative membrane protein
MIGYEHFGMGWGGLWMILVWLIPVVLVALLIYHLARERNGKARSALDILAERYARGEIDREEYLKRRADLEA